MDLEIRVCVLLLKCLTCDDELNPDKVHSVKLTMKNGSSKNWGTKSPLLTMCLIQVD